MKKAILVSAFCVFLIIVSLMQIFAIPLMSVVTLKSPLAQGGYNWCWVASGATVVRFQKGATIPPSVKDFAIKGTGLTNPPDLQYFNSNIIDGADAYGVKLTLSGSMTFSAVQTQIASAKKPFILGWMWKNTYQGGHKVTVYGYDSEVGQILAYWNSCIGFGPNANPAKGEYRLENYNDIKNGAMRQWDSTLK